MYELLNRIVGWALYNVCMWGNHFGWTTELRDLGNALAKFLNG